MSGAEICIEGPDKYVLRTKGGRKIKSFRSLATAMSGAKTYLEKSGGRSLQVKGARFRYTSKAQAERAAKRAAKKRAGKRRGKRR